MKWLIRLYPRPWRRRYEDEVLALLDDLGAKSWSFGVVFDLLLGAVDARLRPQIVELSPETVPRTSRAERRFTMERHLSSFRDGCNAFGYRALAVTWTIGVLLLLVLYASFGGPLTVEELFAELDFLPASILSTLWIVARRDRTARGRSIGRVALAILLVWLAVLALTRLV